MTSPDEWVNIGTESKVAGRGRSRSIDVCDFLQLRRLSY